MGIENLSQVKIAQALNNSDVREALLKKGVQLTEKSIFQVKGNQVQVDVDGDGVYDKTINGLFKKDGSINTNHKKFDVDDTVVNTSYIKQQNGAIKQMEDLISASEQQIAGYDEQIKNANDRKFDEAQTRKDVEAQKSAIKSKLEKAQGELERIQHDYEQNHDDWTSKQVKEYNKKLSGAKQSIVNLQAEFDNFAIEEHVTQAKQKFENGKSAQLAALNNLKQNALETKGKQEQKLQKSKQAYNDYLNKNGYETAQARNAVKNLQYDESAGTERGTRLEKAETTESTVIRMAEEAFKKANPDVKDFNVKYDPATGSVSILLNDGDDIADYTVSGVYDPKKKTLNFDAGKLNLSENAASSKSLEKVANTLRNLEHSADKPNYWLNSDKVKVAQGRIDSYIAQLAEQGITREDIQNYLNKHKK